jgi:hypothetical protein
MSLFPQAAAAPAKKSAGSGKGKRKSKKDVAQETTTVLASGNTGGGHPAPPVDWGEASHLGDLGMHMGMGMGNGSLTNMGLGEESSMMAVMKGKPAASSHPPLNTSIFDSLSASSNVNRGDGKAAAAAAAAPVALAPGVLSGGADMPATPSKGADYDAGLMNNDDYSNLASAFLASPNPGNTNMALLSNIQFSEQSRACIGDGGNSGGLSLFGTGFSPGPGAGAGGGGDTSSAAAGLTHLSTPPASAGADLSNGATSNNSSSTAGKRSLFSAVVGGEGGGSASKKNKR